MLNAHRNLTQEDYAILAQRPQAERMMLGDHRDAEIMTAARRFQQLRAITIGHHHWLPVAIIRVR